MQNYLLVSSQFSRHSSHDFDTCLYIIILFIQTCCWQLWSGQSKRRDGKCGFDYLSDSLYATSPMCVHLLLQLSTSINAIILSLWFFQGSSITVRTELALWRASMISTSNMYDFNKNGHDMIVKSNFSKIKKSNYKGKHICCDIIDYVIVWAFPLWRGKIPSNSSAHPHPSSFRGQGQLLCSQRRSVVIPL